MGKEIERKFLVKKDVWESSEKGDKHLYKQGYIVNEPGKVVRIRLTDVAGFITIKGASQGATRPEYEYEIPADEAEELLRQFCSSIISKTRHKLIFKGKLWEVDEFHEDNEGLIMAEIELKDENETFEFPEFIGEEVTDDVRYYNSRLSVNPFKQWGNS